MTASPRRGLLAAGVAGFGVSALVDVLLLHHVLQWHHLLSNVYDPATVSGLRANVLADGVFSLAMLGVMFAGLGWLWRSERRTAEPLAVRPLAGAALVGLGAFDLFDVAVNHVLLGLHHATHGPGFYDPHWAVASVAFIVGGALLVR
jgi:uncharacterized membrane protein